MHILKGHRFPVSRTERDPKRTLSTPMDISPDDIETAHAIPSRHTPNHELRMFEAQPARTAQQYSDAVPAEIRSLMPANLRPYDL